MLRLAGRVVSGPFTPEESPQYGIGTDSEDASRQPEAPERSKGIARADEDIRPSPHHAKGAIALVTLDHRLNYTRRRMPCVHPRSPAASRLLAPRMRFTRKSSRLQKGKPPPPPAACLPFNMKVIDHRSASSRPARAGPPEGGKGGRDNGVRPLAGEPLLIYDRRYATVFAPSETE
jgi:hypothetical protein